MVHTSDIKTENKRLMSIILLIITAILWSLGGLFIKRIECSAIGISGVRSGVAALVILCTLRKPNFTWSIQQIGGALAYAGTVILYVAATKITTAANAILLQYSAPIYAALLGAWFLKERITRLDWLAIISVFGGMFLFFLDDLSAGNIWGNICAILSGMCFASLAVFMRSQKNGSNMESLLLGNVLTALIGLPFILQSPPMGAPSWISLVLMGIFQLGIPYILFSIASKYVTALELVLIPIIEPILNPIWVFIFLGEAPGPMAILGGFVVLFFVTGSTILSNLRLKSLSQRNGSKPGKNITS